MCVRIMGEKQQQTQQFLAVHFGINKLIKRCKLLRSPWDCYTIIYLKKNTRMRHKNIEKTWHQPGEWDNVKVQSNHL